MTSGAGWYPDPWSPKGLRFWDGYRWTERAAAPVAPPKPPHPTLPFSAALGALVALVVPIIASRFLLDALADFQWPIAVYVAIAAVVGYGPSVWWCWYASRRWGRWGFWRTVGLSTRWSDLGWGPVTWVACLGTQIVIGLIVTLLDIPFVSNLRGTSDLPYDRGYVISLLIVAVIVAPIVEEIVFRGVLMRGLLSHMGPVLAVAMQAVLFGAAHYDPVRGMGNIGLIMVLGSVGATLGGAAYLMRRIGPGMIAHAMLNGLALAIALSGWSGQ